MRGVNDPKTAIEAVQRWKADGCPRGQMAEIVRRFGVKAARAALREVTR